MTFVINLLKHMRHIVLTLGMRRIFRFGIRFEQACVCVRLCDDRLGRGEGGGVCVTKCRGIILHMQTNGTAACRSPLNRRSVADIEAATDAAAAARPRLTYTYIHTETREGVCVCWRVYMYEWRRRWRQRP